MPVWTKLAKKDLEQQLNYIRKDSEEIATKVAIQIKKATQSLDSFPQIGRDGIVKNTKELVLPHLPFICVYRISKGQVEILRLLHERMRWD